MVKGFEERLFSTFRLEDQGAIISIKLSPDQKILAVQRAKSVVEFFNVTQLGANGQLDSTSYEQSARSKTSTILGFYWTSPSEIVYLTSHGIELYNVLVEKKQIKMGRYLNQLITWFVFCPHSCQLVISTSKSTKSIFVFYLKNGTIYKLPKIEIDQVPTASAIEIKEKDVQILTSYEVSYVAVVMHPEDASASSNSEIILYNINKDASTVTKTHRLRTTFNGISGLAMHSIDDVLLVHHKKEGETFFFDIGLSGEYDGSAYHHTAVGKPCKMVADGEYPTHWVVFAPDIIIGQVSH